MDNFDRKAATVARFIAPIIPFATVISWALILTDSV